MTPVMQNKSVLFQYVKKQYKNGRPEIGYLNLGDNWYAFRRPLYQEDQDLGMSPGIYPVMDHKDLKHCMAYFETVET